MSNKKAAPPDITPEQVDVIEDIKPYEFRELGAKDIFLMTPIIAKIGLKQIVDAVPKKLLSGRDKGKPLDAMAVGMEVAGSLLPVLFENLDKCEGLIFKLLAATSNLTEKQISELGMDTFATMLVEFFKKPEFPNFIKAVFKFTA
jgi:hypothetical protein